MQRKHSYYFPIKEYLYFELARGELNDETSRLCARDESAL